MELTLTTLRNEEILHFIGQASTPMDERIMQDIEEMKKSVLVLSKPRYIYQVFPWENEHVLHSDLILEGNDIKRLLKNSHHCIFLAVTLGIDIDKEMRRLQLRDMGKALLFDCCASAAIEHICDQIQADLEHSYEKEQQFLTDRYSCGYGDLPITLQKDFLRVLDSQKKIGLYVNESYILHPMKSVTAILGVANSIQPAILRGCAYCLLRETCNYRKGGTTCGK